MYIVLVVQVVRSYRSSDYIATYRERGKIRALEDYLDARLNVSGGEGLDHLHLLLGRVVMVVVAVVMAVVVIVAVVVGRGGFGGGRRFEGEATSNAS